MNQLHRRLWLKQTALATLGIGFSLDSLAGEDYLPKAAGKESGFLNLGSNENPYGIAPMAKKAIASLVDSAHRYQYNIPSLQSFRKELAAHYGVTADHILLTPGSGEALNLLARHYSKGNLVTATPTFGILPNTAKKIGVPVKEIPLDEGKVHDLPALLQAIDASTAQVYLCNPANPTGTILDPEALKTFCQQAAEKTVVTIDEAYIDFLDAPYNESMIGLVKSGNPNIVVLRTFSKIHAMAGMRVGFVVAHPDTIKALQANYFGNSNFCMSALSMTAAMASLKQFPDTAYINVLQADFFFRPFFFRLLQPVFFLCPLDGTTENLGGTHRRLPGRQQCFYGIPRIQAGGRFGGLLHIVDPSLVPQFPVPVKYEYMGCGYRSIGFRYRLCIPVI